MLAAKNKYLGKAYGKLKKLSADKEWRLEYEARQKAIWDYNSMMKYNYEKGEHVGDEKGEIAGYERGELQGMDLKLKEQIRKKLEKQKNAEQIAEELEEELSVIEELILAMKQE